MTKIFITLLFVFQSTLLFALDIDEKLTCRILGISTSKNTVLMNRGSEDGLAIGDHAKFYLTSGVIARGVVVKTSPARSVWSLYKIVEPDMIDKNKVVSIKISTAIELTDDPSKSLVYEPSDTGASESAIPLADGADDLEGEDSDLMADKSEMDSLRPRKKGMPEAIALGTLPYDKNLEIYSLLSFSWLSTTVTQSATSMAGTNNNIDLAVGGEKYFSNRASLLKDLSLTLILRYVQKSQLSMDANALTSTIMEYGAGLTYHFENPFLHNRIIYCGSALMGFGRVSERSQKSNSEESVEGALGFFSLGAGFKYNLRSRISFRVLADFYIRNETFVIAESDVNYTRSSMGPRLQAGISYRF